MIRKIILCLLMLPLLLAGCDDEETVGTDDFDRAEMLTNIGSNIIMPAFNNFADDAGALQSAILDLNANLTQENLDVAQEEWLKAALSWKYAEMFMFGPVDQLNAGLKIHTWPANTVGIEQSLGIPESINADFIATQNADRKGLAAIEYFLFNPDGDDQVVLNSLEAEERRAYLLASAERVMELAVEVNNRWSPAEGDYLATFVGNTGKDAASSINVLANNFLMYVEELKNLRLGVPIGKRSLGNLLPEQVEARFSLSSLELAHRSLDAIEDVFEGADSDGEALGYEDYLRSVDATYENEPLADVILSQISSLRTELNQIQGPLKNAITDNTQAVEEAYNDAQRLVVLTKADMMSSLGLLVTYQDNDGD